jgi:hypothetical protein
MGARETEARKHPSRGNRPSKLHLPFPEEGRESRLAVTPASLSAGRLSVARDIESSHNDDSGRDSSIIEEKRSPQRATARKAGQGSSGIITRRAARILGDSPNGNGVNTANNRKTCSPLVSKSSISSITKDEPGKTVDGMDKLMETKDIGNSGKKGKSREIGKTSILEKITKFERISNGRPSLAKFANHASDRTLSRQEASNMGLQASNRSLYKRAHGSERTLYGTGSFRIQKERKTPMEKTVSDRNINEKSPGRTIVDPEAPESLGRHHRRFLGNTLSDRTLGPHEVIRRATGAQEASDNSSIRVVKDLATRQRTPFLRDNMDFEATKA